MLVKRAAPRSAAAFDGRMAVAGEMLASVQVPLGIPGTSVVPALANY